MRQSVSSFGSLAMKQALDRLSKLWVDGSFAERFFILAIVTWPIDLALRYRSFAHYGIIGWLALGSVRSLLDSFILAVLLHFTLGGGRIARRDPADDNEAKG